MRCSDVGDDPRAALLSLNARYERLNWSVSTGIAKIDVCRRLDQYTTLPCDGKCNFDIDLFG